MSRIEKILAFDCETTGFTFGLAPNLNHQMVSAGFIVATPEFEPIEELYVEFKWNGKSDWAPKAEEIHGLSREYLTQHGLPHEEAAEKIGGLLYEHWGDRSITLLGTNVMSFDVHFLNDFLQAQEIPFQFSHRAMDTFSLAMATVRAETSDELFNMLGIQRGKHHALVDAHASLRAFREIYSTWTGMEEVCQQVLQ